MATLLDQLRAVRKQAGLSQAELAQRLDVTSTAISRWEVGARSIDLIVAERWFAACGAQLTLGGDVAPIVSAGLDEQQLMIVMRILRVLPRLHPMHREDLIALLDRWERGPV